ncbi:hypothetical protein P692DRAFT_201121243 [Suillus brevipes Sb2]|nr:hypothetical protein P692DRAFT_201121243 [Suillus brevipes Sb2]
MTTADTYPSSHVLFFKWYPSLERSRPSQPARRMVVMPPLPQYGHLHVLVQLSPQSRSQYYCIEAPHLTSKTGVSQSPLIIITSFTSRPAWNTPCPTPLTWLHPPLIMILIQPLSFCRLMDG